MPSSTPYAAALAALHDPGTLRVWSMIATAFGDLALTRGDAIPGPVLSALMAQMDIRPEATRVALHRLRGDDWITSTKSGRTSLHALSAKGRRESNAAALRIYHRPETVPEAWQAVLLEDSGAETRADMAARGFAPLAPRLYLGAATAEPPAEALRLNPGAAPDWLGAQFEPKDLAADYAALHARLSAAAALELDAGRLTPLQIATLRCLVVHGWRRLVLRHPELPRALYSQTWQGHACRSQALALLDRLPKPSLDALSE